MVPTGMYFNNKCCACTKFPRILLICTISPSYYISLRLSDTPTSSTLRDFDHPGLSLLGR